MGKNKEQELEAVPMQKPLMPRKSSYVLNALFFVIGFSVGLILCLQLKAFHPSQPLPPSSFPPDNDETKAISSEDEEFSHLTVIHNMTDQELSKKASSLLPEPVTVMMKRPKVAFMFLTGGGLPLAPLWEKFLQGHQGFYSIYVHSHPSFNDSYPPTSVFYGRRIPSQPVYWGTSSMVDAERRLLANALLDKTNQRFVLLSDSCIPLFNFTTVYNYLMDTDLSFIGSFDDPRKSGRGRYNHQMSPQINISDWRKGSQWFETTRELALHIITDTTYYPIFANHCHPPCYMDEHYIPTLVHMLYGEMSSNRTVTWVDWSRTGPHPGRFTWGDVTDEFLNRIRFGEECVYHHRRDGEKITTSNCFMFARKFTPQALEPLLRVGPVVLGFDP
ncbi:PREDICTED: uncharacterized protein LOC104802437 [Tarenaya hassleriana]|uniref:uncharacterized protein LOC104802437 n=1 Tax=Tarenaya hassleriana TaxID=28532 RepID=UPI00053C8516|nr:PREDICTED: uncharacterized protein LOC104802437 [Tarenaya hassleriana]